MTNRPLWTMDELLSATKGELIGKPPASFSGVSIDTRTLKAGDIFVAIIGDNQDGHNFVRAAFKQGAGLALVSRRLPDAEAIGASLLVDDTLSALEAIGVAARARTNARIAAITGSVGKTGSKEAMRLACEPSGHTHASDASYNNHWGVPLSLARMPADTDFGIFEVGMNHPGEITPLTKMIRPHVALITTVAPVHLGFFAGVEEIARAKAEIFLGVEKDGTAVLNRDNEHYDFLVQAAKRAGIEHLVSFGAHASAQTRLLDVALLQDCSCIMADISGETVAYKLGVPGRHLVLNSLGVLAVIRALGADLALGALALEKLQPPKGRGVRHAVSIDHGEIIVIDESYNANPASMSAALSVLGTFDMTGRGRRVAVLGDMLELGDHAKALHEGLADAVAEAKIDVVHGCGPNIGHLWKILPEGIKGTYASSAADLVAILPGQLMAGDVVMIKGSLGSAMGQLVDAVIGGGVRDTVK